MSVRVRCRCGQELHLRHGEWVYVLLGLVVLCLALNSLAVLLIYLHVESLEGRGGQPAAAPPAATGAEAPPGSSDGSGPEATANGRAARSENAPADTREGKPADRARAGSSSGVTRGGARGGSRSDPDSRSDEKDRTAVVPAGGSVGGPLVVPADNDALRPERHPEESGTLRGFAGVVRRSPVDDPPAVDVSVPDGAPATTVEGPFQAESPLVRLLLLEEAPGGLDWRLSFLLDGDGRLRRRAFEKLRAYAARATATREMFQSRRARELLGLVRDSLDSRPGGQSLLGELTALFPGAAEDPGDDGFRWSARELVSSSAHSGEAFLGKAAVSPLRAFARRVAEEGLDCVLLVDVSQSMERALADARREVARLWPVLRWGLPGIRLGMVLYRDEVVAVHEFSMEVEEQIARLAEAEPTGGGDVPEGLDLAIKEALSLGVFDWRVGAAKHLIVLGDAPPPYARQHGLASIVRRAREQDGFRVHTLGVDPEEGREAVPFFVELAKAGGGRARTVDPKKIASEVTLCLLEEDSAEIVEPLLASAERLLSP